MRNKKWTAVVPVIGMLLAISLTGCGNAEKQEDVVSAVGEEESVLTESEKSMPQAQEAVSEADKDESRTQSSAKAESNSPSETESSNPEEEEMEKETDRTAAFELLSGMTVGWNLGNTFDAFGVGNSTEAETYWGNPRTTKEMIDTVAAQGMNTVRIPVTWAEHLGTTPDYQIDEAWLDRVEEVVDYCLDNDMYVILNTHHETEFWLKPDMQELPQVQEKLTAIWTQIAERFKEYDSHLLFEGMNEPRTKGSAAEWNGGTPEERKAVNELNQTFVDAVRAVGGCNEERCLIICTYGNNPGYTALQELVIPEDNNLAVALHMYTPYVFTYEADNGNITQWDGSKKADIVNTLKQVDKFLLQKDVPVIVTEFGAVNKGNSEEVLKWLADYLDSMNRYGIKCVWWDNGIYSGSGEKFGLLDRRNLTWFDQELVDALVEDAERK